MYSNLQILLMAHALLHPKSANVRQPVLPDSAVLAVILPTVLSQKSFSRMSFFKKAALLAACHRTRIRGDHWSFSGKGKPAI
jgi:hypothetical protein